MANTDTIQTVDSLLLICRKVDAFKREVCVIPVLRHIFEAIDVVLYFLRLEFGNLYGLRLFCLNSLIIIRIGNIIADNRFSLCLDQYRCLFKYALRGEFAQ